MIGIAEVVDPDSPRSVATIDPSGAWNCSVSTTTV